MLSMSGSHNGTLLFQHINAQLYHVSHSVEVLEGTEDTVRDFL